MEKEFDLARHYSFKKSLVGSVARKSFLSQDELRKVKRNLFLDLMPGF